MRCLKKQEGTFLSVEHCMELLHSDGIHIGQTTVYRTLERLTQDETVVKIPSVDGAPALYCYVGEAAEAGQGKLVCLKCGSSYPMHCGCMDSFSRHIQEEHFFTLDQQHTILYGYCKNCMREDRDLECPNQGGE
ncbi:MAG: transcriptional repressor [Clostridiales bacterium]|nr:transcriptional repressor [Clostridiales bacterium]